ncbi:recombinase family protein [Bacillus atrophaeus]|uniref:recombinase family protein n=1 Tax=Bacillus atrophaeus TaxID=1452 RepID=UPI000D02FEF9|nr:recombinase family protein [Bacillus atrophaeus]MCY8813697.1 recombinase family protein [Bacillus atrophaeus]MCY8820230.1 recombinase family protein [Bacillus atrophaeus]MCY8828646.1 recombinase family protein [Bacillus atrophaeus]MCY8832733.1 recombinase family protein [Bacillus atrophaeus]MEC0749733.1 recombinase family protein [Bacillus atrophaeus]
MFFEEKDTQEIVSYEEYPYAVYARVSSEKDEQVTSIQNQIDICHHWIEKNNYEWKDEAIQLDDGISGTVLLDRKAMQLILDKAQKRRLKMVVFKSISRLARDLKDALEIREVLLAHGVRVVTLEEGYDSLYEGKNSMKFEMFSMFAAQYPQTISVAASGALAAKARRGEHSGRIPFGFKKEGKYLVIDEEQAKVVRLIFDLFNNQGYGHKRIVYKLNEELMLGNIVKPQKVDKWQLTTVQTILKNPIYCGVFIANRNTTVKIGGRKKFIRNPKEKWTIYKDWGPKIISEEEYEKANNREHRARKKRFTPWNELRGKMKCGECGCNIVILPSYKYKQNGEKKEFNYLKCSAYRRGGTALCVNHAPIQYKDFRAAVIDGLKAEGKQLKLNVKSDFEEQKKKRIKQTKIEIDNAEAKKKRLIELYLEDQLITKAEFQVKRAELEEQIEQLTDKLFLLEREEEETIDISNIKMAFAQLERTDQDLFDAFSMLIDKLVIYQDGTVDFHYKFK